VTLGAVEAFVRRLAWGTAAVEDAVTRVRLRDAVTQLLTDLPLLGSDMDLKSWIAGARDAAKRAVESLSDTPVGKAGNVIKAKSGDDARNASKAFDIGDGLGRARTIHSAKGESHPAVLLAAARATKDRHHARDGSRHSSEKRSMKNPALDMSLSRGPESIVPLRFPRTHPKR
jgi:hypothetical protein